MAEDTQFVLLFLTMAIWHSTVAMLNLIVPVEREDNNKKRVEPTKMLQMCQTKGVFGCAYHGSLHSILFLSGVIPSGEFVSF